MLQNSQSKVMVGSGSTSGDRSRPARNAARAIPPFHAALRLLLFLSSNLSTAEPSGPLARQGFSLRVRPTVFHPHFFLGGEYLAEYIDGLDLKGKSVADVGTGSGVLALAAARAGAASVLALDINPNAALCARADAEANGFGDRSSRRPAWIFSLKFRPAPSSMSFYQVRPNTPASRAISPIADGTPVRNIAMWRACSSRPASGSRRLREGTPSWTARLAQRVSWAALIL